MNVYRFSFSAECPNDKANVIYAAEIVTPAQIMVEALNDWRRPLERGFHEELADDLFHKFGGRQRIIATHQGVEIETVRP